MKKLIGIFVAAMLFLSGCAEGSDSATVTRGGNDDFAASGQKVESSIFGRNIKYNAFTPAKCERQEITLLLHHAVASFDFPL